MAFKNRLHRSELAVPGSNERMLEKAPHAGADLVFLDLEDAVAVSDKEQARQNVIHALNHYDWSNCSVSVRINGLDTHFCYRDIVDVVEQAGDKLDTLLVPKVGQPSDLQFVALLLEQIEAAKGLEPINLHALIETAMGMANVEAIAQSCPDRLEALVFGVADYAASTQARTIGMGGTNPDYLVLGNPNDRGERQTYLGNQWHFAMSRMIVACRAYGLRPIDGPFGDFSDPEGYLAVARAFAALGGEGKWAIHPSQIVLANQVFTPSDEEIARARKVVEAMEKAAAEGMGAASIDGRMIDAASIRQAEVVLEKVEQIELMESKREAVA
ncbi:MAG: CoA ester lyase [gamma proteobacterium symbiont of Ctena orbiculata]|nr:CoA ester lyase [Candidatus Thiodiazotropha taylori]PVV10829.1 MAG: CoA ester lyase [gamma proteobacterium symbiont of Ctena orbiculata]MBT2998613.1 CoA ester lyase [Candidatus Thiodiazotropha taylori]MBT3001471.1 CoA ester lyase [Candidatus Thiodiazotropha taylori]MBT3027274.1 CoA ester lyase [Candidatus Thiodiazotropha taylori]